jgi:chaperonin cofactor prefoldin
METWVVTIVVQSVGFAIGLFKIWSDLQVKLKELEMRLSAVEKQDDEIYSKLDKMMEKLVAIEIALQNKADR